jgi:hypothetical protein
VQTATATATAAPTATATSAQTPTATATAAPTAAPTPASSELSAAPDSVNFGKVDATGTGKAKKITLTNKSAVAAVISGVTSGASFAVSSADDTCTGQTVQPRKKCSFDLLFMPTLVGDVTGGAIDVIYNGVSPSVSLAGSGVAVSLKAVRSKSLGTVISGQSGRPGTIVVSNPNTVAVALGTAILSGTNPASFTITSDSCSATPLPAKGKCSIAVELTRANLASGVQSATLSLAFTYGANDGAVSVNLTGKVR